MPEPEQDCDLVVLGGGAAGLTAAWRAALAGRSVRLYERAPAFGGLAASFEVAGVRVDHGSHRLHPATAPYLLADLRELLGEDLQTRSRNGRPRLYDRWVGFPLRPAELAQAVPPSAIRRIVRDAVFEPFRRAGWIGYADRRTSYGGRRTADTCSPPWDPSCTTCCTSRTPRSCGAAPAARSTSSRPGGG
ncbi:MAG: FAD-dependent oxidoreductase [Actinomycetota bacterium]|nr:FAD-dependent oxidoreductase [Actinomycetota bacterium]